MDWVSVKFGKDVSSIIHLRVWKLNMASVNTVFLTGVSWDDRYTGYIFFNDIAVANRYLLAADIRYGYIYSFITRGRVVELPKNYFTIKELY